MDDAHCNLFYGRTDAVEDSDVVSFGFGIGDFDNPFTIRREIMPVMYYQNDNTSKIEIPQNV